MANAINWFEIPVSDMERATRFYSAVLGKEMQRQDINGMPYAFFPSEGGSVGGALAQSQMHVPGRNGAVVYLAAGEDLSGALSNVEAAGGTVLVPKTLISPEDGYFAVFVDSEGNQVGLHSMK